MHIFYLSLSVLIAITHGSYYNHRHNFNPNELLHQWKIMEFGFPTEQDKQHAKASGNFEPTNAMLIDVQPDYSDENNLRIFVTIPKFGNGIPYSLATVSDEQGKSGPLLKPYPSYEMNNNENGKNCDAITSAFRLAIDECNHLWVLDSGSAGGVAQCDPQLLVFDLETDQLLHRHRFNSSVHTPGASLLIAPILSVRDPPPRGKCNNVMIYMPDVSFHGLVVHDFKQNSSWRIENQYMYPEPSHGKITIAGESFVLMDGIFGVATNNKNLYFHALASETEYVVPLNVVDNSTLFADNKENMYEVFKPLGQRGSGCAASAIDSKDNLYCVTFNPIKLLKWNVNTPFNGKNIKSLPINQKYLEFVSGMKVVRNDFGDEELWMASNRFQKMAAGTRNFSEINFRIVIHSLENN